MSITVTQRLLLKVARTKSFSVIMMIFQVILPLVDIRNCCQYPHPLLGGFAESSNAAHPIAWFICSTACVCMFVTLVHPAKATEWNEMPYTDVVPSNILLYRFPVLPSSLQWSLSLLYLHRCCDYSV